MSLIDKIVEVKNKANKSLREKHPYFHKILLRYSANKRYGCQFLDEQNRVLEEYTLVMGKDNIIGYEPGINNVWFTMGVKKSLIGEQLKEVEQYFEHPLSTILLKYLPKYPGYLIHRDVKFGKTKE